ncbi:MAG: stage II sporulation protein D [Firmicutes bacterium]|nr:stage II sporulation protein D [Bacillota bacterium]
MKQKLIFISLLLIMMLLVPLLAVPAGGEAAKASSAGKASSDEPASSAETVSADEGSKVSSAGAEESFFRILDESSGEIITVTDREFLIGAVAAEMPLTFHDEALKAQAVACCTIYDKKRTEQRLNPDPSLKGADFSCNTAQWQIYVTKEKMQERWGDAFETHYAHLQQVCGSVGLQKLIYQGEPVLATYYAISAGRTEASEDIWGGKRDYLVAVASPGDLQAPGYETTVSKSRDEVRAAILNKWPDCRLGSDPAQWITDPIRTASGTVRSIAVGSLIATGEELRALFGLRSANFTLSYTEADGFVFTVHGYGHGVGMSQYGADAMARGGADYKTILQWYYPGTELTE